MSKNCIKDEFFMRRALFLAKKGADRVKPNPMVGAVLVKNGRIIAEGYHKFFGGDHAEVNALKNISKVRIKGAVLYVTLEPCCYFGKTPPCTNFLISKGLNELVVAMRDPNPLVAGKGISYLKANGVNVRVGVLEDEAKLLNRVFVKNKMQELPYLSIKLGTTLDGKIATHHGSSKYITNESSRKHVHFLRSRVDAVLTTSETVIKDNPHLGLRYVRGNEPLRVIIDSELRTDLSSLVYRNSNVLVVTTSKSSKLKRGLFLKKGVELMVYKRKRLVLKDVLHDLYKRGVSDLMTEAGSHLTTSLLKEGLVDTVTLFIAPKLLGNDGIPFFGDLGVKSLNSVLNLENVVFQQFDDNIMVSGLLKR
jgi:diaminohydroxyphosphoribosylaminopyrimidine deaminase / 5-amino-6-(5-phosphoribosylamino)uracil reductase